MKHDTSELKTCSHYHWNETREYNKNEIKTCDGWRHLLFATLCKRMALLIRFQSWWAAKIASVYPMRVNTIITAAKISLSCSSKIISSRSVLIPTALMEKLSAYHYTNAQSPKSVLLFGRTKTFHHQQFSSHARNKKRHTRWIIDSKSSSWVHKYSQHAAPPRFRSLAWLALDCR